MSIHFSLITSLCSSLYETK